MPVPWPPKRCRIGAVEERAISVKQLRDLRLFLQRLCKTGLLVKDGRRLNWFELNLYHITELVICPLIRHLAAERDEQQLHSWTELVAATSQKPQFLISHWWGGSFRDFTAVIDELAQRNNLCDHDAVWVCTFANSQFGENFGVTLEGSPFYKAVTTAKETVLLVDRFAGSLTRSWCALEACFTMRALKPFQIYTPAGLVGTDRVSSGPLVDKISTWDVRACEASLPSQRRQIMNYLADSAIERHGLQCDGDKLVVVDGWKTLLDGEELTENGSVRQNGSPEYAYEASLFKDYAEKFSDLNESVRALVRMNCKPSVDSTAAWKNAGPCESGITLGTLRTLIHQLQVWCNQAEGISWDTVTMRELSPAYFKKFYWDKPYFESESLPTRKAQFVIEHRWDRPFKDTVSAIEWFADARRLGDNAVLWIDLVWVSNMWCNGFDALTSIARTEKVYREAQGAVICFQSHYAAELRMWLLLGIQLCMTLGKLLDFSCETGVLACTMPLPEGGWEFGRFQAVIARNLMLADASKARATAPEEEELLKQAMTKASSSSSLKNINSRFARAAAGPLIRQAAASGQPEDIQELQSLCRSTGLSLTSPCLAGPLGETAAHIAAAAGNVDALRALLDLGADPNAEDHIRETPLHYAALAGRARCVKILLSRGANAEAESSFAETPLVVAQQSVAAFLGVSTCSTEALLRAWQAPDLDDA